MRKKGFLTFVLALLLCPLWVWGGTTTDRIVISPITLDPGGNTGIITVSLEGSTIYSAYNMDLLLPEGLEICYTNDAKPVVSMASGEDGIYPWNKDEFTDALTYSHMFGCSYNVVGTNVLRVTCFSLAGENLRYTSGTLFRMKVKVGTYTQPANMQITVSNVGLINSNAQSVAPATPAVGNVTVSTDCYVPLAITAANQYSTLILPFAVPTLPAGLKVYTCGEVDGNDLELVKVNQMEAYTPYILFAEDGINTTLSGTYDLANYVPSAKAGYLVGVLQTTSVNEGFIMQNKGAGPMFYMVAPYNYALPAGKCYLKLDSGVDYVKMLRFDMDEEDAIASLRNEAQGTTYNLQGQASAATLPGQIFIRNGKKYIRLR